MMIRSHYSLNNKTTAAGMQMQRTIYATRTRTHAHAHHTDHTMHSGMPITYNSTSCLPTVFFFFLLSSVSA